MKKLFSFMLLSILALGAASQTQCLGSDASSSDVSSSPSSPPRQTDSDFDFTLNNNNLFEQEEQTLTMNDLNANKEELKEELAVLKKQQSFASTSSKPDSTINDNRPSDEDRLGPPSFSRADDSLFDDNDLILSSINSDSDDSNSDTKSKGLSGKKLTKTTPSKTAAVKELDGNQLNALFRDARRKFHTTPNAGIKSATVAQIVKQADAGNVTAKKILEFLTSPKAKTPLKLKAATKK